MAKRGRKKGIRETYQFEQDESFKKFVDKYGSEKSKDNARRCFSLWFDWVKIEPSEQIDSRLKHTQSRDLRERQFWENKLEDYKRFLYTIKSRQGKRIASTTIRQYLSVVAAFFSHNGLPLNMPRGFWSSIEPAQQEKVDTKFVPSNEHVRAMYRRTESHRDKALLLTLYQSGFSESDVSELRIEHFPELYSEPQHIYISKLREKTNIPQQTMLSREAIHDLQYYLEDRDNPKEGYLFESVHGKQLEPRFINEIIKDIAEKTFGADKAKEFKTHHLRDAYKNGLVRAKLPQELIDAMFGHQRAGAKGHYKLNQLVIEEAYLKSFEFLSINGVTQSTQDVQEIRKQVKGQTQQINTLLDLLHDQKERIGYLEQTLKDNQIDFQRTIKNLEEIGERLDWLENKAKKKEKVKLT